MMSISPSPGHSEPDVPFEVSLYGKVKTGAGIHTICWPNGLQYTQDITTA